MTTPSWKAWQRETMGWKGTGKENRKKYIENIGVKMDELLRWSALSILLAPGLVTLYIVVIERCQMLQYILLLI